MNKRFLSLTTAVVLLTALVFFQPQGSQLVYARSGSEVSEKRKLEIFHSVKQEELKSTRWDTGDTTITNEDRLDIFFPHVHNRGGGYIGLGSFQNFTLAAWARSEYIYLVDFTRIVVAVNKINIELIKRSETPAEFMAWWKRKNRSKREKVIKEVFGEHDNYRFFVTSSRKAALYQRKRFRLEKKFSRMRPYETWLTRQSDYSYIRKLALENRIKPLKGNIEGTTTILSIAEAYKKMDVPVRVIYLTNAEEYFSRYSKQFRKNWRAVPTDGYSVAVRTISVSRWLYPWAPGSDYSTKRGFHYIAQEAENFQKWLKHGSPALNLKAMMKKATVYKKEGLSIIRKLPDSVK